MVLKKFTKELTFIDAWSFNWTTPVIDEAAALKLVVMKPDEEEYAALSIGYCPSGQSKRTDYYFDDYNPSVFFNQDISIIFKVTEGRMFFPLPTLLRYSRG